MSTLILLLAAQPRLATAPADARGPAPEFDFVLSVDGQRVTQQGRAPADRLPSATSAVAVLPPGDVAFQRVLLPQAPAARMRAALAGTMEETLLEDADDVHFALAPGAKAGETHWVAITRRHWLKAQLDLLDAAGVPLDRAVPAWWPEDAPAGHVFGQAGAWQLAWRDAQGVVCVPLASELARGLLAGLPADAAVRWSATPEAAGAASEFAGTPVAAVTEAEQGLRAARSGWNLRQFDTVPQRRGIRQLRDAATRLATDPAWRVVRIGLVALLGIQLVGLNARAFQEKQAIAGKKAELMRLAAAGFPEIRTLYDAPAQAQMTLDGLRAAAGKPGDGDVETLLQAAESAWPAGQPPLASLRFESGKLTLGAAGWSAPEVDAFRNQLRAAGIDVDRGNASVLLSRAKNGPPAAAASPPAAPPAPATKAS